MDPLKSSKGLSIDKEVLPEKANLTLHRNDQNNKHAYAGQLNSFLFVG
jgi:hypothetical protein